MSVDIIIQARMTSTRLPGKILLPVLNKPLLWYQIERLRSVKSVQQIIIATTDNETDEPIVKFCETMGLPYYRGSENDVLARYYHAATKYKCESIVRITSDCPVIDPTIVDKTIELFYTSKHYDYVSNCLMRAFPRGMDTEVFTYQALAQAFSVATDIPDREHVTAYIYRHQEKFNIGNYFDVQDNSRYRLTVDTPEDFELIRRIIETLYPVKADFTLSDILALMSSKNDWFLLNSRVEQKKYGQ